MPESSAASLTPEQAKTRSNHNLIAGNRAKDLVSILTELSFEAVDILPDASRANCLPPACLTDNLSPIYGRAPDAKPQAQRASVP
jgi:hypothetical protein